MDPFAALVEPLTGWIDRNREWAGPVTFLVCFGESLAGVSALVPGTILLFAIGALATTGVLDFWTLALWGILGAGLGFDVSYWAGRRWQARILSLWPFTRYPHWTQRGAALFARWGWLAVFVGRFIGGARVVVSLLAGTMGVRPLAFHAANWASAVLWAPLLLAPTLIASWTRAQLEDLPPPVRTSILIVLVGLAIAGWRAWRQRAGRAGEH